MKRSMVGAVATGLVLGGAMAVLILGEGYGMAVGLVLGYALGCLVMYATVANLRHEEAERMERRRRYGP